MSLVYHQPSFQETLLWTRRFPSYTMHRVRVLIVKDNPKNAVEMSVCLNERGQYIGNPRFVNRLIKRFGITTFELSHPTGKTCSVGWSPRRKKWCGWSHRAIFGFGIGTKLRAKGIVMRLKKDRTIRTLAEAKRYARMFARAVS